MRGCECAIKILAKVQVSPATRNISIQYYIIILLLCRYAPTWFLRNNYYHIIENYSPRSRGDPAASR